MGERGWRGSWKSVQLVCWSVHSGHWVENGFWGSGGRSIFKRPGRSCGPGGDGDGWGRDAGGRGAKAWMDARVFPEINHDLWQ